jgi:hypothetical protein
MTAGLPSTGLGGVFYLVNMPVMLIAEINHTLKGNSSRKRWRFVGNQFAMVFLMLLMAVLTGVAITVFLADPTVIRLLNYIQTGAVNSQKAITSFLPTTLLLITPFATLLGLFSLVFALRFYFMSKDFWNQTSKNS